MASKAENEAPASDGKSARAGRSPGRKLVRVLLWGLVLLIALFGLSNLWLRSGWGTGVAEAELKKRTGQDWEIGSMSWSPWNGVTAYEVKMHQPEGLRAELDSPVVRVESIRVTPYWKKLLNGKLRPKLVEIERPELNVSVEMLAMIAANADQGAPRQPRLATPSDKTPPPDVSRSPEIKPKPKTPPAKQQEKRPEPLGPKPTPPAGKKQPEHQQGALDSVKLVVRNAGVKLVALKSKTELLQITGAGIEMDLLGGDSEGVLKIGSIRVLDMEPITKIEQPVVWKTPYLEISEQAVEVGGVKARMIAQLGLGRNPVGRFPFLLSAAVDPGKLNKVPLLDRFALDVSADRLQARMRMSGYLHQPVSWHAEAMLVSRQFSVSERHGGHDLVFDEVLAPCVFRRGVLQWDGLRIVSEDLAVLGNGAISLRDGHLSVTRIVTSPEGGAILKRGLCGAGVTRAEDPWWEKLDTPDREMRDLLVTGPLLDPVVDAGEKHSQINASELMQTLLRFIRREMREQGVNLKPLPGETPDNS